MSPDHPYARALVGVSLLLSLLSDVADADRARPFAVPLAAPVDVLRSMALGDVDGDGRADLIASAYSAGPLTLRRSVGNGAFEGPVVVASLTADVPANALDLLDLDQDGHLDLVAVTAESLYAFVGLGDGSFTPPTVVAFPAGEIEANARAWADVDDDGALDLLAPLSSEAGAALVAHGLGGGFAAPETLWLPLRFTTLRMADANADGRLDLFAYSLYSDSLCVRLAGPAAAWSAPVLSVVPNVRAIGDQDGDGRADVWAFQAKSSSVWRGSGDGTFIAGPLAAGVPVSAYVEPIVADQDGDGRADLLTVAAFDEQGALVLLRSQPDGSLRRVGAWGIGGTPIPFGVADVDGDGLLDAVTVSRDVGELEVLRGDGPEQFVGRRLFRSQADARSPSAVALADLDHDGRAELLFESGSGNQLTVYRGMASGELEYVQDLLTPTFPEGLSVADLDGDGWNDVVIAGADGPIAGQAFALNQGNGTLALPSYLTGLTSPSAAQALPGEFDAAQGPDLLYAGGAVPRFAWQQAPGNFTPLDSIDFGGCIPARMAVGRMNADALDDVVFLVGTDSIGVAVADGARGFWRMPRTRIGTGLTELAVHDLDTDGRPDVAVLEVSTSTVVVLRSTGTGTFAAPVRYDVGSPGTFPVSLAIGDVDADGFMDLAVSNARDRSAVAMATLTVWYGDRYGGFHDRADLATGPYGGSLALGDVDGNGTLDLAVANGRGWLGGFLGSHVSVLMNTFPSPTAAIAPPVAADASFAFSRVWPNPLVRGRELRLDLNAPARGEMLVELIDLQGRRVLERRYGAIEAGRHSLTLASERVPPGLYFARVTQGARHASQRVVVL